MKTLQGWIQDSAKQMLFFFSPQSSISFFCKLAQLSKSITPSS